MNKKLKDSIFISIASYRDSELIPSILDCVNKAHNKKRLFFGICLQDTKKQYYMLRHIRKKYKLKMKIIFVDWKDSQGACWGRHVIQKKIYNNQTYYLQLDSHHRFLEQWDEVLVHFLENKKQQGFTKPIIGGYCPGYHVKGNICDPGGIQISSFDTFTQDGDIIFRPQVLPVATQKTTSVPARFLSGHFIFCDGIFCKECIYDPNLYFRGEEITLSARAYTHGYDLFHPTFPIIWHYYLRPEEHKHWNNHQIGEGFLISTNARDKKAKERVRKLLGIEKNNINFGQYGLGNKRPLHEYELYAGLDFAHKNIHKNCYDARGVGLFAFIMSEKEWSENMLMKKLLCVRFSEEILAEINENLKHMIMCIENKKNLLLYRIDITYAELQNLRTHKEWKKEIGIEEIPSHAILIPFHKNNTFGKRIKTTEVLYYDVK